jgi:predicted aldo/keto reductase-like oxidoreductase
MIYRALGKTGLKVSQLGFGAMRLPMVGSGAAARVDDALAVPMIRRAFDAGVNYIDTAVGYCNSDSQRAVGVALRGYRDRVVLSTKNPYWGPDEKQWWQNLTDSLTRLGVEYIDIYNHHGMNHKGYLEHVQPHMAKWMRQAKDQGLIRHICTSFHDNNQALRDLLATGYVDVVTLQYNMLDRSLEDAIALAHERGVGVVVMGPVAGGRLGVDSPVLASLIPGVKRVPELALRFVLANPHVSLALSGMGSIAMVEENLRVASDNIALSPADTAAIQAHLARLQKMSDLYCTGCNYCKPCPQGVDISAVFAAYNLGRVWGLWDHATQRYAELVKNKTGAEQCATCGECADKCPQKLAIAEQLQMAHAALTAVHHEPRP